MTTTAPPLPEPKQHYLGAFAFTREQLIERDKLWLSRLRAAEADALRYRWLRDEAHWNQELSAYSSERLWLWSTRFASRVPGVDDTTTRLDAAIDAAMEQT